jgi:uncharacterized SAM-binding protein YcdF (DUF218 family)
VNEAVFSLGLSGWKPFLTALLLPPTPWLLLVLVGARWLFDRRPTGWLLLLPACLGMWLSSTSAGADALQRALLPAYPALTVADVAELRQAAAAKPGEIAIVVLGGGREALAPEYGMSNLNAASLERLRYGIWLARETGIPLAFSGGVGHAARGVAPEAEVAARIAVQDFNVRIRWLEPQSRDTRENASFTIGALRGTGVRRLVIVTHGWHMPRAMRAFREDVARTEGPLTLTPAPMGLAQMVEVPALRWLPSSEGQVRVRQVLREWIGLSAGL